MSNSGIFYFLRHGQTEANEQGLSCGGDWDVQLTKEGRRKAFLAAQVFSTLFPMPVRIYSSPNIRAIETAQLLNRACNLPIEIISDLHERHIGALNGQPEKEYCRAIEKEDAVLGLESLADFDRRLFPVFETLSCLHTSYLIVAHGGVGRSLERFGNFTVGGSFEGGGSFDHCVFYKIHKGNSGNTTDYQLIEHI